MPPLLHPSPGPAQPAPRLQAQICGALVVEPNLPPSTSLSSDGPGEAPRRTKFSLFARKKTKGKKSFLIH